MLARIETRLPPLWLSASALTAAIAVVFGIQRWVAHFVTDPYAEDIRVWIVATRIGLTKGWSHIYDLDLQKAASAGFPPSGRVIDLTHFFVAPPPDAWILVPVAWLPIPATFVIWTLVNLAAFIVVGWLVSPGSALARATLILVGLALWPVHFQFWLGQWVVATLALVGLAWWLLDRGQAIAAGAVLALGVIAKPQDAWLVPVALLVGGRWRPVIAFAVVGALLGAASLASLGASGVNSWSHDLGLLRASPYSGPLTYSWLFGRSPLATAVEVGFGIVALGVAWMRRDRLDLVFALGIVGTMGAASYLHEDDVAMLVLAAWIVLRSNPSLQLKLWLLAGIAAAQFIAIGQPIPMLVWEPGFLVLLAFEPSRKMAPAVRHAEPAPA